MVTRKCLPVFLLCFASCAWSGTYKYQLEAKLHYRSSDDNRFATAFPFSPAQLPVGQSNALLETVDPGDHFEISTISFSGLWRSKSGLSARFRIDAIDLYDRNPTSDDHEIDLDSLIIKYQQPLNSAVSDDGHYYLQVGKFAKFERQEARRLESYGVVSTTFNRFEDSGIEAGIQLGQGLYGKFSYTTGNPVFIRDTNALAGDNGTRELRESPNPDPSLGSGIVTLYDAEIENFDLSDNPELGLGIGYRWQTPNPSQLLDVLLFGYERELAQSRSLNGTFYGADLDLFDLGEVIPGADIRLPVTGDKKREYGLNIRYQYEQFNVFGQVVSQDLGGLDRHGYEIELAYTWNLPIKITPVIRYSELSNRFIGNRQYPAPSVWWDWTKIDYGLNLKINKNLDAIIEYTHNEFERGGRVDNNNELLLTLRIQWPE